MLVWTADIVHPFLLDVQVFCTILEIGIMWANIDKEYTGEKKRSLSYKVLSIFIKMDLF
jgi:hypothetical protein